MDKNSLVINGIILFYLLQRLSEVLISRNNEEWLRENCQAVETNPNEGKLMKVFHSLWFVALIIEANIKKSFQPDAFSLVIYFVLLCCLIVRIHTMEKLKRNWTVKVLDIKNHIISTEGLFKYVRHPNYFIVILELIFIPLLVKAYFTMVLFTLVNFYIQGKRIQLEEKVLMKHDKYRLYFSGKKRFIPFVFSLALLIAHSLNAAEMKRQFSNYAEAKKADEYIRFDSESKKMGFLTTGFDGFALSFKVSYELEKLKVKNLKVTVPAKDLDTDNDGRNKKMLNSILEAGSYPEITADLIDDLNLSEGEQKTNMAFTVKGKRIVKPVNLIIRHQSDGIQVNGRTTLKLTEAGLPDPSIMIAKVRDDFDLSFSVLFKKQSDQ